MIAAELVRQAQRGDQRALGDLLAALRPTVVRYCATKLDRNDAEDVAQDALMRLVNAIDAYRPAVAPIEAYAMRITWYTIANHYRRERRGARVVPLAEIPEQGPGVGPVQPEEHVLRVDQAQALTLQLQAVSPQARTALLLRAEGFSTDEVAEHLGSTPGAVRVARWRAVQKLRKAVTR